MFPSSPPLPSPPRFVRLDETGRAPVLFTIDGHPATALEGDTLLVAMLSNGAALRRSEFGDGTRSGFCLMGACQDCWVWTADGGRLRACSTNVADGMAIATEQPEATWPVPASSWSAPAPPASAPPKPWSRPG